MDPLLRILILYYIRNPVLRSGYLVVRHDIGWPNPQPWIDAMVMYTCDQIQVDRRTPEPRWLGKKRQSIDIKNRIAVGDIVTTSFLDKYWRPRMGIRLIIGYTCDQIRRAQP